MQHTTYNPHPKDKGFGNVGVEVDHVQLQGVVEAVDVREGESG